MDVQNVEINHNLKKSVKNKYLDLLISLIYKLFNHKKLSFIDNFLLNIFFIDQKYDIHIHFLQI
jgi:hypothetical protein